MDHGKEEADLTDLGATGLLGQCVANDPIIRVELDDYSFADIAAGHRLKLAFGAKV